MTESSELAPRRRLFACLLAAVGIVIAMTYVLASPGRVVGYVEKNGQLVEIGRSYMPGMIALVSIQAVAAMILVVGVVAAMSKKNKLATRSFGVATIVGLIPTIIPGVLAFFARKLIARKPA